MQGKANEAQLLEFWRQLECLTVQAPQRPRPWDRSTPVYVQVLDQPWPWEPHSVHASRATGRGFLWGFTIQSGVFPLLHLHRQLYEKLQIPLEGLEESTGLAQGRIFDFRCDDTGRVLPETFSLSLGAYAYAQVITHGLSILSSVPERFQDLQNGWNIRFAKEVGAQCLDRDHPSTGLWNAPADRQIFSDVLLQQVGQGILTDFGAEPDLFFPPDTDHFASRVLCRRLNMRYAPKPEYRFTLRHADDGEEGSENKETSDDGIINSFFLDDLHAASTHRWQWGVALQSYLSAIADDSAGQKRMDVRAAESRSAVQEFLDPRRFPAGRWPSDYPLSRAQQLSVNLSYARLAESSGIFSVNGPPGTGKTTLLRDLFAAVITDRAQFLSTLEHPKQAFGAMTSVLLRDDESLPFHPPVAGLAAYTMLVASSNNGAVENITQELPLRSALGQAYQGPRTVPNYFAEVATVAQEQVSWAWLAVPLGKFTHRARLARWMRGSFLDPEKRPEGVPLQLDLTRPYGILPWLQDRFFSDSQASTEWKKACTRFREAREREVKLRDRLQVQAEVWRDPEKVEAEVEHLRALVRQSRVERRRLRELQRRHSREAEQRLALRADLERQLGADTVSLRELSGTKRLTAWLRRLSPGKALLCRQWDAVQLEMGKGDQESRQIQDALDQVMATDRERILRRRLLQHSLRHPPVDPVFLAALEHVEEAERELAAPWADPEWLEARAQVFLQAIQLHKIFWLCLPQVAVDNLEVLRMWLYGFAKPDIVSAFTALSLLFPVVSSTFAALQKFLPGMPPESLGWLFVDEAGQATPAAAVGALFRARRAVVVGDPLQLPPIPPVPAGLERRLADLSSIPAYWQPSHTSVQVLADQATPWGTWVSVRDQAMVDVLGRGAPSGKEGRAIWVGSPLRVHRRCLDPMFSISNGVAYDGLMVQGRGPETAHPHYQGLPPSQWIDVQSTQTNGHWVPEEGYALEHWLRRLRAARVPPSEIFLISPFRDVVRELRRLSRPFGLDPAKVGTIHTTQGKESAIVILVLGGRSGRARDWAGESPHLLNVAASRARERLYVIGDRSDWSGRGVFGMVMRYLPAADPWLRTGS